MNTGFKRIAIIAATRSMAALIPKLVDRNL